MPETPPFIALGGLLGSPDDCNQAEIGVTSDMAKVIAYIKASNSRFSIVMPLEEDSEPGAKWAHWRHTGEYRLRLGDRVYRAFAQHEIIRARDRVLARVVEDRGL
jgi:hypothetical protein